MKKKRNLALADDIKDFLIDNSMATDTRIYFNGIAYDSTSHNTYQTMEDIKGSTYCEYADDDSVTMCYEGDMYDMMNYGSSPRTLEQFRKIFTKHKCKYEVGYAWSLTVEF